MKFKINLDSMLKKINSFSTLNVIAHQLKKSNAKITFHEYSMLHLNVSSNLDNSIGIKCYKTKFNFINTFNVNVAMLRINVE